MPNIRSIHESAALKTQSHTRDWRHTAERFGTPLIVIDEQQLRTTMRRFRAAFVRNGWACEIAYAAKALALKAILNIAHAEGLLIDVCSEGELQTLVQAGVPPSCSLLHGCAKTDRELELAVQLGVAYVVLDHQAELEQLARMAQQAGVRVSVIVRVNTGIAASTKTQIQTAGSDSKFGFALDDGQAVAAVRMVCNNTALRFLGLHCHLGSQIGALGVYAQEVERLGSFALQLENEYGVACEVLNVGGGLAVPTNGSQNTATPETWAHTIYAQLEHTYRSTSMRPKLIVEPGRAIIARAGTTVYSVVVRKRLPNGTTALIVDGGMSDNPRPALYDASYQVSLAGKDRSANDARYTIFGRHCETDLLFRDVALPDPQPGDLLLVHDTGAYTYSMASNYNRFPRPAVVLGNADSDRLIARREPLEHLLDLDLP